MILCEVIAVSFSPFLLKSYSDLFVYRTKMLNVIFFLGIFIYGNISDINIKCIFIEIN